eukprot:snap_masked-scaffold_1-processed-gene-31.30-mRNA-1 protein AED:1.00 eAED:1.00 QI:0/-1/0/0/-1/1/1/0/226
MKLILLVLLNSLVAASTRRLQNSCVVLGGFCSLPSGRQCCDNLSCEAFFCQHLEGDEENIETEVPTENPTPLPSLVPSSQLTPLTSKSPTPLSQSPSQGPSVDPTGELGTTDSPSFITTSPTSPQPTRTTQNQQDSETAEILLVYVGAALSVVTLGVAISALCIAQKVSKQNEYDTVKSQIIASRGKSRASPSPPAYAPTYDTIYSTTPVSQLPEKRTNHITWREM